VEESKKSEAEVLSEQKGKQLLMENKSKSVDDQSSKSNKVISENSSTLLGKRKTSAIQSEFVPNKRVPKPKKWSYEFESFDLQPIKQLT
jgi:hypothetical protein